MRGLHRDGVLRMLLLPLRGKGAVVVAVELAGGVVTDIEQADVARARLAGQDQQAAQHGRYKTEAGVGHSNLQTVGAQLNSKHAMLRSGTQAVK